MKENKNAKRLMIYAIVATMCLSSLTLLPTNSADCPDDCPSGMISYWKLDEVSGTTAYDCYGPNDATNNGATINQPGQVGTAYSFNGAGDYILAPSLDSQIGDNLTIAAWLYNDESTPGATNAYFRIFGLLHLRRGGGVWDLDGEGGLSDVQFSWNFDNHQNEWHYHVVTLDVSGSPPYEVRAFVDGVEEPGSPFAISSKSTATYTNTYIGQYGSSHSWEGSIDEVALYNRVLSAEEISSQYDAGLTGLGYCGPPNDPPTANFTYLPSYPYKDDIIQFTDTSYDLEKSVVSWWWDFGDNYYSDLQNPVHCYYDEGVYDVNLTIEDNNGAADSIIKTITVAYENIPPVSDPNGPYNGIAGDNINFDGSGSYDTDGTIVNYTWDFRDSETGYGMTVDHSYAIAGEYNVILIVTDDDGAKNKKVTSAVVTAGGSEILDVEQSEGIYAFMAYGSRWAGQSFIPSINSLTKVQLLIGKKGTPGDDLTVSVRSSLTGADIDSITIPESSIPTTATWFDFDLPDMSITSGNTHYIVVHSSAGNSANCYVWTFGYNTAYTDGALQFSSDADSSWAEYLSYDLCFRTFGNS